MPRQKISLEYAIEELSILDEEGHVDEELEPEIAQEELLEFHRYMLLARRFDERLLQLQREGEIGTFAPVKGQEACQIGSISQLDEEDWFIPAFRETAAMLWRGVPMEAILLFNAGYNEGARIEEGQRDLPIAIPVASQIPHATGIAYGIKYREKDEIALTYFGDGATSEGDFYEALNFAGVYQLPVVFVCQNNQYAISLPREKQTKARTLAQKSLGVGIPGIQVDGNDLLAVWAATKEAVERARSGKGATLIECVTYRREVHTTADDPSKYRDEEEVEQWKKRDPIDRLQKYLDEKDLLEQDELDDLEEELDEQIEKSWQSAQEKMDELDDPLVLFEHLFKDMPAYLQKQREDFKEFLKQRGEE